MVEKDKKITTINVYVEILNYCKKNKLSLSEWVNTEFKNKYISVRAKVAELEKLEHRKEELIKEIKEIKDRNETMKISITTREMRFLETIGSRLEKGAEWKYIKNCYNNEHNRDLSIEELQFLYKSHKNKIKNRLEMALKKHNK
jgi:hypothetical protein